MKIFRTSQVNIDNGILNIFNDNELYKDDIIKIKVDNRIKSYCFIEELI